MNYPQTTDSYMKNIADASNQLASKLLEICHTAFDDGTAACLGSPSESPSAEFEAAMNELRANPTFHFTTTQTDEVFKYPVGAIYDKLSPTRTSSNSKEWIQVVRELVSDVQWIKSVVAMSNETEAKLKVAIEITKICGSTDW